MIMINNNYDDSDENLNQICCDGVNMRCWFEGAKQVCWKTNKKVGVLVCFFY